MFSIGKKNAGAVRPGGRSGGLSFIAAEMVVSGDVAGAAQLHVDGRVDGNVRCDALIQGQGGTIAGHIEADSAHIAGLVDGTVKARLVTLEPTARVTGDVTYETLSIAAGAGIEGRLTRRPDATPRDAAILPPAPPMPRPATRKIGKAAGKGEEPGLLGAAIAPAPAAANG